jgi:N-acetylglucosamine malate deacetylase 1
MRKVAVVVAHADDEILGCGGTLAKHSAAGDTIHVIYMCAPVLIRKNDPVRLDQERRKALAIVGNGDTTFRVLGFRDQKIDTESASALCGAIEEDLIPFNPDIVYTHHPGDPNKDHVLTYEATRTATTLYVLDTRILRCFEIPSKRKCGEVFAPNYWNDISPYFKAKCTALRAYKSECKDAAYPISVAGITALAAQRGKESNCQFAEAFKTIWERSGACH